MRILHSYINGVKVWILLLMIIACTIVMAVLLDSPRVLKSFNEKQKTTGVFREGVVKIDGISFRVAIADSDNTREKGLGGVTFLGEREGMLFVFPRTGIFSIWMKDMKIPIDILWINDGYRIVKMERDVSPDTYPKTFQNNYPARFVLELPAGTVERYSINSLSTVSFDIE
jgi:uncharacterized membrane protein (UPF0127 family)